MLSEGITVGTRAGAWLHRDAINGLVKARRGARIVAVTCGGAIPELGDFRVVTENDGTFVGTVNEDFALESNGGDIFLLGNTSWMVRYVRGSEVYVTDAQGAPATVPFWLGEAPGRTIELSEEVSRLRENLQQQVQPLIASQNGNPEPDLSSAITWLKQDCGIGDDAAIQAVRYAAAQVSAIGLVPTLNRVVFERFFDESGGMQLVIHAPWGARINRAWGLAFRKRFCRSFDFELQASADEDGIVLSLGPQHSFPIDSLFGMLTPENGRYLLEQALLAAPVFQTRWRWCVTRALAVLRNKHGQRVPPNLQRFRSDDLLAAVFPAQAGCLENHHGDTEIPDHPLIHQTVEDCLHEAMDVDRWLSLLADIQTGRVELIARDTREPSPFSHEILNANPYAFLDGAPLEERRARAVTLRRGLSFESASDLGRLDPEAIATVRAEAWPLVRDADELHDALHSMCLLRADEAPEWTPHFEELISKNRATRVDASHCGTVAGPKFWTVAERWPLVKSLYPRSRRRTRNIAARYGPPELGICRGPRYADARPHASQRPRHRRAAWRKACAGAVASFCRAGGRRSRRHRAARPFYAARRKRTLQTTEDGPRTRTTVQWCERRLLGTHSPPHARWPAAANSARRTGRFHPLPPALASPVARSPMARPRRLAQSTRTVARLRNGGWLVGAKNPSCSLQ